jgi:hypothetical protein
MLKWKGKRGLVSFSVLVGLASLVVVVGCASITITEREEYEGARLARPAQIRVHDFAVSVEDLPKWSELREDYVGSQASMQDVEAGRELGGAMAKDLVKRIQEMGLTAARATDQSPPAVGDIVLVGYLSSVDEGSAFKRVVLGFGKGAAEISSHTVGYVATKQGIRKLGSGTATSTPGKTPGVIVPIVLVVATANPIGLIVTLPLKIGQELTGRNKLEGVGRRMTEKIAEALEVKFREQGWIGD